MTQHGACMACKHWNVLYPATPYRPAQAHAADMELDKHCSALQTTLYTPVWCNTVLNEAGRGALGMMGSV